MKKIAPVAPKERKKQRSERGLTPTGLTGRNQATAEKTNENSRRTIDKARFKIYPIIPAQSTDKRQSTKSTHLSPPSKASSSRISPENDTTTAGNEPRRQSSPLPDTSKRGGRAKRVRQRDERDGRRAAADGASTSRKSKSRPARVIRRRHGHDDIIGISKAEETGNTRPVPRHETTGSKAGRYCDCAAFVMP